MEEKNIPDMHSSFEEIKKIAPNGNEYWTSRELCGTMGYSTYYRFAAVIKKAITIVQAKGMIVDDHFLPVCRNG